MCISLATFLNLGLFSRVGWGYFFWDWIGSDLEAEMIYVCIDWALVMFGLFCFRLRSALHILPYSYYLDFVYMGWKPVRGWFGFETTSMWMRS